MLFVFGDRVPLCSSGCPDTHLVNQAGLELRDPCVSASLVLGLKACATTAQLFVFLRPIGPSVICRKYFGMYTHTRVIKILVI